MNLLCTICARSGSKGLPNKNIKKLLGKPLLTYTIDQALKTDLFKAIVVSSNSREILEISKKYGADAVFERPENLALDSSPKIPAIRHAFELAERKYKLEFDVIIDLDVTSPLRLTKDIEESFNYFVSKDFDNLITGCPSRKNPYFNMVEIKKNQVSLSKKISSQPASRQSAPQVYEMNASIYIWKRQALLNSDNLFTDKTGFYEMPEERSHDIDSTLDWHIVEMIMKKNLNKDEKP